MTAIRRLLAAVTRRQRLSDAAWGLSRIALPSSLLIAAIALVAIRGCLAPPLVLWLTALPVPIVLGWALARRHRARKVARRVDACFATDDLLGSALELTATKPSDDPRAAHIVELLVARAEARAATLDPHRVVELEVARPKWWDGVALLALVAAYVSPLGFMRQVCGPEEATEFVDPTPIVIRATPRVGSARPIDMPQAGPLRDNLRDLVGGDDDVAADLARQMLDILDRLEKGEIDRATALAELQRLEELLAKAEQEFEARLEEDPATLSDALRDLAEAFEQQELTEEVAAALAAQDGEEAEKQLNEAGEQAETDADAETELQKALEEAERRLAKAANRKSQTDADLDEAERRLRREQKNKPSDPEEQQEHERRLKRQKDNVERLRRQQEREEAARKRLEQLRREAKQAQQKGANGSKRKQALQKLSRGMKQAAQTARGSRRLGQARDGMQEAKSIVRRAGDKSEGQQRRKAQFRRFSKAAKGDRGKDGKSKEGKDGQPGVGEGKDGKGGKKGEPTLLIEGDVGDGQPDMMMEGDGSGQEGQGQEGEGEGQGEGEGEGQGEGQGKDGAGNPSVGDGIGQGSAEPLADPSGLNTNKKNVRVKAREGKGATRAEVIRDASQQGFASEAYRRVFQDYRGFAQSAMDSEALPAAQRRRVKRYYQLITPRE